MSQRIQIIIGLVTSALGVIGVTFALFGPVTFSYGTNWLTEASTSLWDAGLDFGIVVYLAAILLAALGVTAGVYLRERGAMTEGTTVLWISVVALFVGAVLTLPGSTTAIVPSELHTDTGDSVGIGIYFIPAAFMALVTAIVNMAIPHTPARRVALRPH